MTGIYKITNLVNKKMYIGQAVNIEISRWKKHKSLLRNNRHWNKHLQASWNKYGENNFIFEIIIECHSEVLNDSEEYFISYYNTQNNKFGYNKTTGGDGIKNYKHTDEAKVKISIAAKRYKLSEENKNKLIKSNTGRIKSKEELKKLSEAAKGRKISEWHKQQLINSKKDKLVSDETRLKISQSRKGFKMSEEQKLKLSLINKGKPSSNKKINQIERENIFNLFTNNPYLFKDEIAKQYNVSYSTIYGILKEFGFKNPPKICSEEQRVKNINARKGKNLSQEWKNNIGKAVRKNHGYSKFSEEQIDEVVKLLLGGLNNVEIEKITGVSYSVIIGIRNKSVWSDYTKNLEFPQIKNINSGKGNSKLIDKQVIEIIKSIKNGL